MYSNDSSWSDLYSCIFSKCILTEKSMNWAWFSVRMCYNNTPLCIHNVLTSVPCILFTFYSLIIFHICLKNICGTSKWQSLEKTCYLSVLSEDSDKQTFFISHKLRLKLMLAEKEQIGMIYWRWHERVTAGGDRNKRERERERKWRRKGGIRKGAR